MDWNVCRKPAVVFLLWATALPTLAAATVAQGTQGLQSLEDHGGANGRTDHNFASPQQDAETRFNRGLELVKLNRPDDAIEAFAGLSRDYPQLPGAYNNLAVLYAQKGDYARAVDAIKMALHCDPEFAIGYINLGDLYSSMAGAAYRRALQFDRGAPSVPYKLSLINRALGGSNGSQMSPVENSAVISNKDMSASANTASSNQVTVTAPTPQLPGDNTTSATQMLDAWANAWSSKDVDGYLSHYAASFQPEDGASRSDWESGRREHISKPHRISVHLLNPQLIRLDVHRLRVNFVQVYSSDTFNDKASKSVELSDNEGSWKIVREQIR